MINGIEMDFHCVGSGEKNGDAIALRYRTNTGRFGIHVVDGGTEESGKALVQTIRNHYDTNVVDHVISTHADLDHTSGLRVVLEELSVGALWINRPWLHVEALLPHFADQRITRESLIRRLRENYYVVDQLESLARRKNVDVFSVFEGTTIGPFVVLHPTLDTYLRLLLESDKTPKARTSVHESWLRKAFSALITVTPWAEALRENVSTAAENETSVVQIVEAGGTWHLLTGDAGPRALTAAFVAAQRLCPSAIGHLGMIQIPHHGSRHNVTPGLLDKWVGKPPAALWPVPDRGIVAVASVSRHSKTHPRKVVVHGFARRGAIVVSTAAGDLRHYTSMPERNGWYAVTPHELPEEVETWG